MVQNLQDDKVSYIWVRNAFGEKDAKEVSKNTNEVLIVITQKDLVKRHIVLVKERTIEQMSLKLEELVGKKLTEEQLDEAVVRRMLVTIKQKDGRMYGHLLTSGALVKCRKVGAKNWGTTKKEGVNEGKLETFVWNSFRDINKETVYF